MGRKKNEELTDEERRRRQAENARLRRKNFTDKDKRKHAEAQRRRREKRRQENTEYMRVVKPVDQVVLDNLKLNRKRRDQLKKKELDELKKNDPARYREHLDKMQFKRFLRTCGMSEEQKEAQRQQKYLSTVALEAKLTPEELEERRRKNVASTLRSQKKRRENETEEEKQQRRIYLKIRARKWKLRKELFNEGLSKEEVKRKADEEEELWWMEVYPGGKPPPRKRGNKVKSFNLPCAPIQQPLEMAEIRVFKFNCVKCHPLWRTKAGAWQPVGFNHKSELLIHVMEKHPSDIPIFFATSAIC